jgi:NAD(P)-binding Rossmann-like domain
VANTQDTDYLVIGAGASGLAFADELFTRDANAHITLVDKRDAPGGHWNDVYPFVRLHQPATFYGVESRELAHDEIEVSGPNAGCLTLSEGPEIVAYFHNVLRERLLPSGRVSFVPSCEVESAVGGSATLHHLLSGQRETLRVRRKVVDASWLTNTVPRTHTRKFTVAPGVTCVPPNDLPLLAAKFRRFVVLGAGKTALDACLWLLANGAPPDAITWVVPRDSWFINRGKVQAAMPFFDTLFESIAQQREAMAAASSAQDLALRLEACGAWLRLDASVAPRMFHYATVSEGELALLRGIRNVLRQGRVLAIEPQRLVLEQGEAATAADETLFIDCTASAISKRAVRPVFDGARITLQMIRIPQPSFSAACVAFVEATMPELSDDDRNRFAAPIPLPDAVEEFPLAQLVDGMNRFHAAKHAGLREWMAHSRLDGYAHLMAAVPPTDTARMALLLRVREATKAAMGNLPRLAGMAPR